MQSTITGIQTGTSTETSKLLTKILNTFYTSGIDRIKTYGKTLNGNIVGEFVADGTSFQYILNMKTNTVSYEPVGNKIASKTDSLLAEQENTNRFKAICSVRESFDISDSIAIEQKLDSWFLRADATAKAKIGVKAKANKSGKTLTCTPGKTFPCGAVCRAMGKPCKQQMSPEVQEIAKQVAVKIKTPTAATTTSAVKPTTTTTPPTGAPSGKITAQKMAEQIAAAKTLEPDVNKKSTSLSKFSPKLINIKRINAPTEEFAENDLRAAAESFLQLGGFVNPPVVRKVGNPLDPKYEVVSGQFEIAAGIVAKAIDSIRGETINAMVIDEENKAVIAKQMKAQKSSKQESPETSSYSQQQIQEIAKQLEGNKPNLTPVYVKKIKKNKDQVNTPSDNNEGGIFNLSEFTEELPTGQVFQSAVRFIKSKKDKPNTKYDYEVVSNGNEHILEASRLAKNQSIRIMLVDDEMEKQLKVEAGK